MAAPLAGMVEGRSFAACACPTGWVGRGCCLFGLSCEPLARMLFFPLSISLPVAALAAVLEATWGYPHILVRTLGHPVMWVGALINRLDTALNLPRFSDTKRRWAGGVALALIVLVPVGVTELVLQAGYAVLPASAMLVVQAVATTTLVAQKSLWVHVAAVGQGLRHGGLAGGRQAVSQIVGRDTSALTEAGIVRAALESLAENFSDGIVAPLFWAALFGLPGAVFYKAVNTADSMIGHLTPKYGAFGMAVARLDDVINLPASRLAAVCLVLAAPARNRKQAWQAVWRDAPKHRSPNAGWPEAAMAGALGLRLAGPRLYAGIEVHDSWMGQGTPNATVTDLDRGLAVYRRACAILIGLLLCAAALFIIRV